MNEEDNSIEPVYMYSGRKSIKLSEIVNAIRTIKAFSDFRDKINELLVAMASAGVDVSRVNFNDPISLIKAFSTMNSVGVDIDLDTIIDELDSANEVTLEEVEEAVRILTRYMSVAMRIDSTLRRAPKISKTGISDIQSVAKMFGLKVPGEDKEEEYEYEEQDEYNLSEEELEDIRRAVSKYKSRRSDG